MHKYITIFLWLFYNPSFSQTLFNPSDTKIVISGVLSWIDPSLSSFSDKNRKDKELHDVFKQIGVPDSNNILLLNEQATLENMKKNIRKALSACGDQSTFIFYYAGHGMKKTSGYYFCNYDGVSGNVDTWFDVSNLGVLVEKYFKGKRIVLMADCCYSGSLLAEAEKISRLNKEVVVLSSATSSNISTGNWTFTQTLIDCLHGNKLADHDMNGIISLEETAKEVRQAMKYREYQLNGFVTYKTDATKIEFSKTEGQFVNSTNNTCKFKLGDYVYADMGNKWEPARVLSCAAGKYLCEFYHYSDKQTLQLGDADLREIHFVPYHVNDQVQVDWEGKYCPATIEKSEDGFYYISYAGYDDSWNEWVMYDRIWSDKEKNAQIEWEGNWYPGYVIEEKGGLYFIHYKEDNHSWDEWVDKSRIKFE